MFTKPLTYIITKENLKIAFEHLDTPSSGLDDVTIKKFAKNIDVNISTLQRNILEGHYSPEPLKKIEIDKPSSKEKRPIGISSIKDKIIQRVLFENLRPYFEKRFSNASYAYQSGKSTYKALNRVTDYLNRGERIIVKTDIDNFFETIDHKILLSLLEEQIKDSRVIRLIALFINTGSFKNHDYDEHLLGIYQGDILSPLLSNIYLDVMDRYLDEQEVHFVRYADDFVILFKKKDNAYKMLKVLRKFLKKRLKLSLEQEKTQVVHISDGFSFLGIFFNAKEREVDSKRFEKTLQKIQGLSKKSLEFYTFVSSMNSFLLGLKNYYLKIIQKDSQQIILLQDTLRTTIAQKIYLAKKSKKITTKKEFKILLKQIQLDIIFPLSSIKSEENHIIAIAYERYTSEKSYKNILAKIHQKRDHYTKKFANDTTLHIAQPGLMLAISKNKFVVKKYGKVQHTFPINKIERVVFEGKGFALSSAVIKKCADKKISIDFISFDASHYASLVTYKASMSQMVVQQAKIVGTPLQLELAKAFVLGKTKNQLNYIKYLHKYHKHFTKQIYTMKQSIVKIKTAQSVNELMGYEGSVSVAYWDSLQIILKYPFENRITHKAKDIVNSSLNYAYAFLYGRIQHYLIHAGLNLNISFLHTSSENRPTLSFDMIEEFRSFIVDRTIISMLNKDEPIRLGKDGLLTAKSRQLIAKNIKEKLGSYTMWKKKSIKIESIIETQCYKLVHVINEQEKRYRPFIGKF